MNFVISIIELLPFRTQNQNTHRNCHDKFQTSWTILMSPGLK